jgi:hypothetical protein
MSGTSAFGAVSALAATQHGAFSRAQASERGLERGAIRRLLLAGVLDEPIPTVLVLLGTPRTWEQLAILPTLTRAGAVLSHRAAGRLHGIVAPAPIEVTIPRDRSLRVAGVTVHRTTRWNRGDITVVNGIRCTSIARTLCDLGASADEDVVEQALDEALRGGASSQWIDARFRDLERPGPSGTARLGRVLAQPDRAGALPDSWFERTLARAVVAAGLPPLTLQHRVHAGTKRFWLDGAYPELQLGVEADSERHHGTTVARRKDRTRAHLLRTVGWELLHAGWEDRNGDTPFIGALREAHRRRSASHEAS